jgi:hypothetical protein
MSASSAAPPGVSQADWDAFRAFQTAPGGKGGKGTKGPGSGPGGTSAAEASAKRKKQRKAERARKRHRGRQVPSALEYQGNKICRWYNHSKCGFGDQCRDLHCCDHMILDGQGNSRCCGSDSHSRHNCPFPSAPGISVFGKQASVDNTWRAADTGSTDSDLTPVLRPSPASPPDAPPLKAVLPPTPVVACLAALKRLLWCAVVRTSTQRTGAQCG